MGCFSRGFSLRSMRCITYVSWSWRAYTFVWTNFQVLHMICSGKLHFLADVFVAHLCVYTWLFRDSSGAGFVIPFRFRVGPLSDHSPSLLHAGALIFSSLTIVDDEFRTEHQIKDDHVHVLRTEVKVNIHLHHRGKSIISLRCNRGQSQSTS